MARARNAVVAEARVAVARDEFVAALDRYVEAVLADRLSPGPAILTATQAAELLGVHHSKVYDLVRQGLLSALPGFAEVRLSRVQVLAYANGETTTPSTTASALQLRSV